MKVYEIKQEFNEILSNPEFWDENWEITEEGEKALSENQDNLTQKAEGIAKYMANLDAEADAYTKEIARMSALKTSKTKKVASLKKTLDYLLWGNPLDTELFKFTYRKSESAVISDDTKLKESWIIEVPATTKKESLTVMKKELNEELKVRKEEAMNDGRDFDEVTEKTSLFAEYGIEISVNNNLQIK